MGAKDSKRLCLPYEDAIKRLTDAELKRICEAFKRLTGGNALLNRTSFIQNVLGDGVPPTIADWLYTACGGTPRGIALRDLVCGLVLLTRGTTDEKIKFLWTLYCNDAGTFIVRNEFKAALQVEGLGAQKIENVLLSLFGCCQNSTQERCLFDNFKVWLQYNRDVTILSKWLLRGDEGGGVSLTSDIETPTFYQTLAGVTHLEEQDICELEKCFWALQGQSQTGHLDLGCVKGLVCPPIPQTASEGLFLALDVNGDGHVDFKELCCGISAACRGPTAERMKFCFKMFDMDQDLFLNDIELKHMFSILKFINNETVATTNLNSDDFLSDFHIDKSVDLLAKHLDRNDWLSQEEFLMWCIEDGNCLIGPLLELLFQLCHVSLGLRPDCRHHEYEIVTGWLSREERRGYHVGQFWYLISMEWWQNWLNYTTTMRTNYDVCNCPNNITMQHLVEEGIVCDESLISNSSTTNSNSMESMGDLLSNKGDSCSIASSSGVSSSSGTIGIKHRNHNLNPPGPIENTNLVIIENQSKVTTLTGEGGRLKRDTPLVQNRDFILVPDSLWKALALWYGGPLPLPRQVIRPTQQSNDVELELYPLNLKIMRHSGNTCSSSTTTGMTTSWTSVVGGYGAAALNTAGIGTGMTASATNVGGANNMNSSRIIETNRYLGHMATFSRLATIKQMLEFLCLRLLLKIEDVRLWHMRNDKILILLEDENLMLEELGVIDGDQILLEVRNKDLTWPEELGALAGNLTSSTVSTDQRRPTITPPAGATGLHNLGNTCFMNAALQAVSNTRPLTLYFQYDQQLSELNNQNPLGTKGMVAKRYAELCRELWTGSLRSIAPLKLRYCLTKYASHLSGGGQHDSQELLAWLLDALHEDLNRVGRKIYVELKDSGGRPDEIVAEEAWKLHLNRDHSIITDLFYGQLKSKVTCQTCGNESVRFDPFNLLSLPLPMESYILCEIIIVRLNGEIPIKYGIRLNSDSKYIELKEQLQINFNINSKNLLIAEMGNSQIKQIYNDDTRIVQHTATELYGYEVPNHNFNNNNDYLYYNNNDSNINNTLGNNETTDNSEESETELDMVACDSPLARSPENNKPSKMSLSSLDGVAFTKSSISQSCTGTDVEKNVKYPNYLLAVHRKCVRQETYFLTQQKSKPILFGLPLLLGCTPNSKCKHLYELVWNQITRLLSPLPQSDQTNHATDCDDSLGYEFPFQLKAVLHGGQICAICHWTQFCRGCTIPLTDELLFDYCKGAENIMLIAIDWDPTALHLRYQSNREKLWIEDESVLKCRKQHTEPIDLDYCLKAFTQEEQLETKYHCSKCQTKQPATKKLQIWRLPPILIIHLKRFDYVNQKWVKTQKMVNFPFDNFDPTEYLASIPKQTILRHRQLLTDNERIETDIIEVEDDEINEKKSEIVQFGEEPKRCRVKSTSLLKTPILDEHLQDYHQHKLLTEHDPYDLRYKLYAIVSHSGLLNGGHYISYAHNPNGNWYCYNDSSCKELTSTIDDASRKQPKIDTSSAYMLFYERYGLDYKPYLPHINNVNLTSGGGGESNISELAELDENESELRKQLCSVQ